MNRKRLIIFTRYPDSGQVKTRLIPALGLEGATALHRRLVLRTLRTASAACEKMKAELEIHFVGGNEEAMRHWLGDGWLFRPQHEGDLGNRMSKALGDCLHQGASATVIIGSDCPGLTAGLLIEAFDRLSESPVVLGPANDGGYYLIGLRKPFPELFCGIAWGGDKVLADSLRILERDHVTPALLPPLDDLDRPEDLIAWEQMARSEEARLDRFSVIIPALNEAKHLAATLKSVQEGGPHEIILVDGGSTDETQQVAIREGATVLVSRPGRSRQMNAGCARATGNALLFLHADTLLPPGWTRVAAEALRRPGVAAGAFRFRVGGSFAGKSILEWGANLRSKRLQLPYGDQGLFLSRALFEELGGFANLPIMEDYEFLKRVRGRGRVITVTEAATTSGRRWEQRGFFRATLANNLVLAGYVLGVRPQTLARLRR